MKRLVTLLLVAGLTLPFARAIDPRVVVVPATPLPTSPQVPPPVIQQAGGILPASKASRLAAPAPERSAYVPNPSSPARGEMPLPTGFTLVNNGTASGPACAPAGDCAPCDGKSRSCLSRLKDWACFHGTSGGVLPVLRPQPYIGPVVGIFPCTSAAGCGYANGNGCGPAGCAAGGACAADGQQQTGRGGLLASLRGNRGQCISPADDAIPGYRFAAGQQSPPAAVGVYAQPAAQTVYKPAGTALFPELSAKPPASTPPAAVATPATNPALFPELSARPASKVSVAPVPVKPAAAPPAVQPTPVLPAVYKPAPTAWNPYPKPSADPSALPLTRP